MKSILKKAAIGTAVATTLAFTAIPLSTQADARGRLGHVFGPASSVGGGGFHGGGFGGRGFGGGRFGLVRAEIIQRSFSASAAQRLSATG